MIAVDTNILVYSHRQDSGFHADPFEAVKSLAESPTLWATPWPALHEFLAIVTHQRIYSPPTPMAHALVQITSWMESSSFIAIGEVRDVYIGHLTHLLNASQATGARVHDARIAAICLTHGADELWSADRDFSRYPGLTVRNPLVAS